MLRVLLLLAVVCVPALGLAADDSAEELPVALSLVPEMQSFAELDWATDHLEPPLDLKQANASVAELKPFLAKQITAARVRAMSKWAQKQMADYKSARLDDLKLEFVARNPKRMEWLLESTLQTLPSHSPLVDRWLKLYVVYDQDARRVTRVILTIRGQALE